jgi:dienelactone hydrolase
MKGLLPVTFLLFALALLVTSPVINPKAQDSRIVFLTSAGDDGRDFRMHAYSDFSAAPENNLSDRASSQTGVPVIPGPTGRYRVGTAIFHLVDTSRGDFVTKKPGQFNEMMIQIWYPAEASGKHDTAPYVSDNRIIQEMLRQKFENQTPELINNMLKVKTHSVLDAPLQKGKDRLPLLLASPGIGSPRFTLTSLSEDLASHGYIVVTIDHPYCFTILPDGRVQTLDQVPEFADDAAANAKLEEMRAKDASFVLSSITDVNSKKLGSFARRIDKRRVGIWGHSTGGAVALEASRSDVRFKAAINLDGLAFGKVVTEGFNRPSAVFASHMDYSDEELAKRGRTREQMKQMGGRRTAHWTPAFSKTKADAFWVEVAGTNHIHFSDYPFIMPTMYTQFGGQPIDQRRGFIIITTYMREFFDRYLLGRHAALLGGPSKLYPEVFIRKMP